MRRETGGLRGLPSAMEIMRAASGVGRGLLMFDECTEWRPPTYTGTRRRTCPGKGRKTLTTREVCSKSKGLCKLEAVVVSSQPHLVILMEGWPWMRRAIRAGT